MEKDLTIHEAWLKETCRELFNQSLMAEQMISGESEFRSLTCAEDEIASKTKFALQIITGCDEGEALLVLEEISSQEIQRVLTETNTEYARQVLKDSFNFDSSNNNEET